MTILFNDVHFDDRGALKTSMYQLFRYGMQLVEQETDETTKETIIDELVKLVGFIDFDATREECEAEMISKGLVDSIKRFSYSVLEDEEETEEEVDE